MPFSEEQVKLLTAKLSDRFVKSRHQQGRAISFIEGWHAIAEANRIFGFDAWDRETVWSECIWQEMRREPKSCAYAARVRIRVRAGEVFVIREGSGVGHGTGSSAGEAHESALKEAETDATKRALVTFGNPFGLALYDKEQRGVRRRPLRRVIPRPPVTLSLVMADGSEQCRYEMPESYCSGLRDALTSSTGEEIEALWTKNEPTVALLRTGWPQLKTVNGTHYADVLRQLYEDNLARLKGTGLTPDQTVVAPAVEKSELPISEPKRMRDPQHLRYVASLPCLVCGRMPSHAHHLRFAHLRAMSSKVSDEWTVPLCVIHHRALHDTGSEEMWWIEHSIDAKRHAELLWRETRGRSSGTAPNLGSAAE